MTDTIYRFVSAKYDEDGDHLDPHFGTWCDECGFTIAGDRFDCVGRDTKDEICESTLCLDCYTKDV